jgi:hypothetical protein
MEVRMPAHLVSLFLFVLAVAAVGQQTNVQARINQHIDQHQRQISEVPAAVEPDMRAARLQAVHQDANELSALSASVESDLEKLQQGLLVKDLNGNLRKMEKLSKKLRREMQ